MNRHASKKFSRGDIVEVEWFDTHASDRLTHEEVAEIEEPLPTVAYGVVIENGPRYLTIASEICLDPWSDGNWVEQIPHGAVKKVRSLGRRSLDMLAEGTEGRL